MMEDCTYKDPRFPVQARVKDLMDRMTLNEKVNQLGCEMFMDRVETSLLVEGIGEIAVIGGLDSLQETAEYIKKTQEIIIKQSSHGIPALFHCEALSGPSLPGCCLFPTSIGLGATFSPEDVKSMANITRSQLYAAGIRQALSPVLDLSRDFRWGRTGETYGSDPTLVSAMGCAYIAGLQGNLSTGVAATAKHFLGYSQTENGLNMARTLCDERELREAFAKPFEAAVNRSKLKAVMNSYSEINGVPVCASKKILSDLLRDELGFNGVVVSDSMSINRLVDVFFVSENITDAAIRCLKAGLDVELPIRDGYSGDLREAVKKGELDESYIDRAVERMLKLKFELGLFEHPYPNMDAINKFDTIENNRYTADITRKMITLLKNDRILPLRDRDLTIAVIGPTGDSLRHMYGCYTYPAVLEIKHKVALKNQLLSGSPETAINSASEGVSNRTEYLDEINALLQEAYPEAETIFGALKKKFGHVSYTKGCATTGIGGCNFHSAVKAAKEADIVILTIGGKSGWGLSCTSGEGVDSTEIGLPGLQHALVEKIYEVNKKIIVIHTDSKPLVDGFIYDHIPAVIEAWLPGTFGGQAIAEVITGECNPGGRLPVDVPRSIGQMPVYHYQHNGSRSDKGISNMINQEGYVNEPAFSRLPFGYGLSYTDFKYSDFQVTAEETSGGITLLTMSVTVTNSGGCAGDEVIQLYGKDILASVIRPQQELIGFKRISLDSGESRTVSFRFNLDQLAFRGLDGDWIVEKGEFLFFVGRSSSDAQFKFCYSQAETIQIDPNKRSFFADAEAL
jgi:Beta-glucosidase-related glycosidases